MRHLGSVVLLALLGTGQGVAQAPRGARAHDRTHSARFLTYNASLHRSRSGGLIADLRDGEDVQARRVAEILQRLRPDVVLLNEFDHDPEGTAARLFERLYLNRSQDGRPPIAYAHRFLAAVNTGVPSGCDLDGDGKTGGAGDAFGFGRFPGQYGMLLLSRYPIVTGEVRTFRRFLWKEMPGASLPDDPSTEAPGDWYEPAELEVVRLSSKSHWDVPLVIRGRIVHVLAAHPTPPVFDGPEDRNGRRNHDEIRLLADLVTPGAGSYIRDDDGRRGGLPPSASFVVMGDLNADPTDGGSVPGAVRRLLALPRVNGSVEPRSRGGAAAADRQGRANAAHRGDPSLDTADFSDDRAGNLRVDYVLPSSDLLVAAAGVFWPDDADPGARLMAASDHRPVWVDLLFGPLRSEITRADSGPAPGLGLPPLRSPRDARGSVFSFLAADGKFASRLLPEGLGRLPGGW